MPTMLKAVCLLLALPAASALTCYSYADRSSGGGSRSIQTISSASNCTGASSGWQTKTPCVANKAVTGSGNKNCDKCETNSFSTGTGKFSYTGGCAAKGVPGQAPGPLPPLPPARGGWGRQMTKRGDTRQYPGQCLLSAASNRDPGPAFLRVRVCGHRASTSANSLRALALSPPRVPFGTALVGVRPAALTVCA